MGTMAGDVPAGEADARPRSFAARAVARLAALFRPPTGVGRRQASDRKSTGERKASLSSCDDAAGASAQLASDARIDRDQPNANTDPALRQRFIELESDGYTDLMTGPLFPPDNSRDIAAPYSAGKKGQPFGPAPDIAPPAWVGAQSIRRLKSIRNWYEFLIGFGRNRPKKWAVASAIIAGGVTTALSKCILFILLFFSFFSSYSIHTSTLNITVSIIVSIVTMFAAITLFIFQHSPNRLSPSWQGFQRDVADIRSTIHETLDIRLKDKISEHAAEALPPEMGKNDGDSEKHLVLYECYSQIGDRAHRNMMFRYFSQASIIQYSIHINGRRILYVYAKYIAVILVSALFIFYFFGHPSSLFSCFFRSVIENLFRNILNIRSIPEELPTWYYNTVRTLSFYGAFSGTLTVLILHVLLYRLGANYAQRYIATFGAAYIDSLAPCTVEETARFMLDMTELDRKRFELCMKIACFDPDYRALLLHGAKWIDINRQTARVIWKKGVKVKTLSHRERVEASGEMRDLTRNCYERLQTIERLRPIWRLFHSPRAPIESMREIQTIVALYRSARRVVPVKMTRPSS